MYINSRYGMIANSFGMPETQTCYHKNRVQTLSNSKDCSQLLSEANGGVQGATPLAHWGVFSMSVSGA